MDIRVPGGYRTAGRAQAGGTEEAALRGWGSKSPHASCCGLTTGPAKGHVRPVPSAGAGCVCGGDMCVGGVFLPRLVTSPELSQCDARAHLGLSCLRTRTCSA